MTITESDRKHARETAARFIAYKRERGASLFPNHISKNIDYEEALRRGILTEWAFAHVFGGEPSSEPSLYGDGGTDFWLSIGQRKTRVNVKTKSVRQNFWGMVRVGTDLRVPVHECDPDTIYIFGAYFEPTDDAEVYRWEWGHELIKLNKVMTFDETIRTTPNYTKRFEDLRPLAELLRLAGLSKEVLYVAPQPPDLQEWIAKYGSYKDIPWQQWDEAYLHFQRLYFR